MTPKLCTEADRTIGGRIAAIRAAQGLTQTMLGAAIGVSFQQVQKYEKAADRISAGRLQAVANYLRVPVAAFFDDPTPAPARPLTVAQAEAGILAAAEACAEAKRHEAELDFTEAA